ncbi:hypothetical protein AWB67_01283 [Caballeronia terrestris]|uniref:Uncharacterized protein n=1 Tax=Caballeronia terrestris TaxID=1226301 RepID=A0A158GEY1_9BURK|nr:hypothetical protein AWB67_01283 [Caballeronia terrestris]
MTSPGYSARPLPDVIPIAICPALCPKAGKNRTPSQIVTPSSGIERVMPASIKGRTLSSNTMRRVRPVGVSKNARLRSPNT